MNARATGARGSSAVLLWLFLFSLGALTSYVLAEQRDPPTVPSEYVGSRACATCHPSTYESYQAVGMARSFNRIAGVQPIEDWTQDNTFYHEASDQYFEMSRRNGRYFQRRYKLDASENKIHSFEKEIDFILGSGNKERDYFYMSDAGELIQFPAVWYADAGAWGMAPGYDRPDHEGFSRRVEYRCFFCHNAYPDLPEDWTRYEARRPRFIADLPSGIGCERCHGPGREHVERASTGSEPTQVRTSIVNPARLTRKLQLDVCMQCHLETSSSLLPDVVVKEGRGVFSYRPGEPLEDYVAVFDYPPEAGRDEFNIVHQAYRLRKSLCFTSSEMTCTSCHDPHRVPEDPATFYKAKCLDCHPSADDCTETRVVRAENGDDCIACHMPERRTHDVVRATMTDHYIQRRRPSGLLTGREEPTEFYTGPLRFYLPDDQEDLYMGLALSRGADVPAGVGQLAALTQADEYDSVSPLYYLASGHQSLGRPSDAIRAYRRVLEIDSGFTEARYNLAIALIEQGNTAAAVPELEEVLRQDSGFADAHIALARARGERLSGPMSRLDHLVLIETVRRHNLSALEIDPYHTVALNNLGLLEIEFDRLEEAAEYFERALAVDPNNETARTNLDRISPQN